MSSQRTKQNLFELHSSQNGGERALASSPHSITFPKVTTIAEAPPVRRNQQLTPSIDSAITISARRSFGMLNELCSSKIDEERAVTSISHCKLLIKVKKIAESPPVLRYKQLTPSIDSVVPNSARRAFGTLNELHSSKTDGERAAASSPDTKPSTMEQKIARSQHQLPHNNPETPAPLRTIKRGQRCSIDNLEEPFSSKTDGVLASASTLSKEFYYIGVSRLPLSECQPGCHYKSWLFQARNHVRWRPFWAL